MNPTTNQIKNSTSLSGSTLSEALEILKDNSGGTPSWETVTGKPTTFPPSAHAHPEKQDTLVSGTNIKTINGSSILGSGDLVVAGGGGGSGTVTSVSTTVPTGFAVAGSPITTSGTIAITYAAGYSVPTNTSQASWDTAFGWGNHASAGYLVNGSITTVRFAGEYNAGNSSTALTVDFTNGQKQKATLTGNATITLSSPAVGSYQLKLVQDATGSRTVTWSPTPKYVGSSTAPAINTTANSETIVSVYYDGTSYYLAAAKVNA